MLANDIAVGGSIILTFPSGEYVLTTTPSPACAIAGTLFKKDAATSIVCAFAANTVTITNFAAYVGGGFITVNVHHVLNPSNPTTTGTFTIESFSENGLLQDATYSIMGVNIIAAIETGKLAFNSFTAFPTNGSAVADYIISFTPTMSYPKGTSIEINFPITEFSALAAAQTCSISGGLSTLASCTGNLSNRVTLVTDEDYSRGSDLNITVHGLTSFGAKL
jgi:hypothetical protein